MKNWEKAFDWTFEDYRNKESLAYMVPTIGDIKKLKQFIATIEAEAEERGRSECPCLDKYKRIEE